MISILQQAKSPMAALGFSLLMAMLHTLLEISCYMLRSMKSMSFASLHTPHMHCKVSSVRIIQKHDLMGFNSLGCSRILTIQEVLSSRHGGTCSAQYRQDHPRVSSWRQFPAHFSMLSHPRTSRRLLKPLGPG